MVKRDAFYKVATDIGGTFTDLILLEPDSLEITIEKVLTTPADPSDGVITGLRALAKDRPGYIKGTSEFIHATTLVVNAVVERKGAKTALLCTRGFRDVLELRRHLRVSSFEMWNDPPEPLVPRYLRIPITERTYSDGRVLASVTPEEVQRLVGLLTDEEIESIAVAFLHSYVNPSNEEQTGDLLKQLAPHLAISLSSQVVPQYGEYERTATTVINAYTKPVTQRYLHRLRDRLGAEGFETDVVIPLSNGGLASMRTASEFPVRVIQSGPVAGAVAARLYGQMAGLHSVLSFDMGGTTAKACLIQEGALPMTSELEVARSDRFQKGSGYPVAIPSIDLIEVGAGGGSIARINKLGLLQVGPKSAGADPGPICYGFGGKEPTVTDADLVVGYLNPSYFLGGEMRLDLDRATRGLKERLADPLGRELQDAAWTVHEVVNENMVAAVRIHVVERGGDPSRCTLVAFGGAGPVHAYQVAHKLGIEKILVPLRAGVMSAVGLVAAPPAFDLTRTYRTSVDQLDAARLEAVLKEMEGEVAGLLSEVDPSGEVSFDRWADVRYIGQGYQIRVSVPDAGITHMTRETMWELFTREYQAKYGYFYDDVPGELVNLGVRGQVAGHELKLREQPRQDRGIKDAVKGQRPAYSATQGDLVLYQVYDRYLLSPGMVLKGPAIVEERESTTVVDQGGRVEVDPYGTLVIAVA